MLIGVGAALRVSRECFGSVSVATMELVDLRTDASPPDHYHGSRISKREIKSPIALTTNSHLQFSSEQVNARLLIVVIVCLASLI